MADQVVLPADIAKVLERDDLDEDKLTLLSEVSTAVVQAAAHDQRIVYVANDTAVLLGTSSPWLQLPQLPVAQGDITSVTIDGDVVTDYKQFGARLWRRHGWRGRHCHRDEPGQVEVVYGHGIPDGSQDLQLARKVALSLCATGYGNPEGLAAERLDDYAATFAAMTAQMEASPTMQAALRRKYGRRAGIVSLG